MKMKKLIDRIVTVAAIILCVLIWAYVFVLIYRMTESCGGFMDTFLLFLQIPAY